MKLCNPTLAAALALTLAAGSLGAQTITSTTAPNHPNPRDSFLQRTFYLKYAFQQNDANEIVTALRNTLSPEDRVYLLPSQNSIVMRAPQEEITLAEKILSELDRPKKTYRVTYTLTEMEGTKRIGAQHFAMVLVSGQKTSLKQNSRVPILTGSGSGTLTQFTYADAGINFEATLDELSNGARLRSLVDQSSAVAAEKDAPIQQPVMRHVTLEGASFLAPGKPLMLGSMDIPGSTRRLDVEVVMEPLP